MRHAGERDRLLEEEKQELNRAEEPLVRRFVRIGTFCAT